jgi:hypothetical protein
MLLIRLPAANLPMVLAHLPRKGLRRTATPQRMAIRSHVYELPRRLKAGGSADQVLRLNAIHVLKVPTIRNISAMVRAIKLASRNRSQRPNAIEQNNRSPINVMIAFDMRHSVCLFSLPCPLEGYSYKARLSVADPSVKL